MTPTLTFGRRPAARVLPRPATMRDRIVAAMSNRPLSSRPTALDGDLRSADLHGADLRGANLRGANLASLFPLPREDAIRFEKLNRWRKWGERTATAVIVALLALAFVPNDFTNFRVLLAAPAAGLAFALYAGVHRTSQVSRFYIAIQNTIAQTEAEPARVGRTREMPTWPGAILAGANLTGADLTGANMTHTNLSRANLRTADLRDADLTDADLTDADLTGANLTGANLSGARLVGTLLPHVSALRQVEWSIATDWAENRQFIAERSIETDSGHYMLNPDGRTEAGIVSVKPL